jgi:hypothetical protein
MESFVKKIKALVEAKKMSKNISIVTSAEFANELVLGVAELMGDGEKTKVTGAIVSTRDLTNEIEFKEKKQFQGVKRYILDTEMSKEKILNLCKNFPKVFLALSFKIEGTELKIKPKAPKSPKSKNKEESPKADFCRLKTNSSELINNYLFDIENFKKVRISHDFIIEEIILPEGEENPLKMRELAKRKGKIIRKINLDDSEKIKEVNFIA